jgi:hypothetical protein
MPSSKETRSGPVSEAVLKIVHAFSDEGRRQEVRALAAQVAQIERENDILRGIAAKIMPCHYCGVKEIGLCPHGFPGCSLADDMQAGEDCMAGEIQRLRAELSKQKGE